MKKLQVTEVYWTKSTGSRRYRITYGIRFRYGYKVAL